MQQGTDVDQDSSDPATDSFRAFYEHEFELQVRRAGLVLNSPTEAADVVHDAFVAVWQRWGEVDDPGRYLNRCVINSCRTAARRSNTHDRALKRLQPLVEHQTPGDVLWDALQALDFDQRAPIVLRYYGRLDNQEIAAALDWPYGSVGPRITKGLRTLRKAMR